MAILTCDCYVLDSTLLARPHPGCSVTPTPVPGVGEALQDINKLVISFTCMTKLHSTCTKSDNYKEDERRQALSFKAGTFPVFASVFLVVYPTSAQLIFPISL